MCKEVVKVMAGAPHVLYTAFMEKHLFVIDDDLTLRDLLKEFFEKFGFRVTLLENGLDVESRIAELKPDIVVLDVMMPGRDGVEVLKGIRSQSMVPVIMLTARGEDMDRILGLELGADDYMGKPFNPRELLARVKAVLRRSSSEATGPVVSGDELIAGGLRLDRGRQELHCLDGTVELSTTEFRLLEVMMERADRVLSREQLMQAVHERDYEVYDRSIDVHISKLRSKIKNIGGGDERIRTYWGSGYMFIDRG